jgi:type I restriction enzyme S subunit
MNRLELPYLWQLFQIGNLCEAVETTVPGRRGEGTFRYVDISSIDNEQKYIAAVKIIANREAPSRARQIISAYDVIVSTVRPNLNAVAIVPEDLDGEICSTDFCILRAKKELLDPKFIFAWVRHPNFIKALVRLEKGIGYPAVRDKDIKQTSIPLPPLSEQKRIVAILGKADEICRLRKQANEKGKKFLQSVFFELFGNPDPTRNDRGWEIVKLEDFLEVGTGGTPSRSNPSYYGGSSAWVKTTELRDNIITSTEETITATGLKFSKAKIYPENTIVLAMYGQGQTRGRTAKLGIPAATNQACAAFLPSNELLPNYLWYWFQNSYKNIRDLAIGTPQSNLNLSILKNLEIPKPDLNLQQRFESLVDEYLQLEALSTTSFDKTDSLFKSLLSNAFTGELTAAWRDQHQAQLAAAECDPLLQISQPVDTKELADEKASETKSSELHRDRDELLRNLSKSQRKIYESVIQETAYFTPECLEEKYSISLNIGQKGLQLLAAAGLIVPVTLPTPTSSGLRYELAYRNLNQDYDTCYSDDVALLNKDVV